MARVRITARDCARALWLLGLVAPVDAREAQAAWRQRVSRTHPDLHVASPEKVAAAETLTRALNEAKDIVLRWIEEGREWPSADGGPVAVVFGEAEPWPEREAEPGPVPICRQTGLRAGDRVRLWPYQGDELETVSGTERDGVRGPWWVLLEHRPAERADRVRLAAYTCPVCGQCAGPVVAEPTIRPCPECLTDLRRIERRPAEGERVRKAIEARAEAGLAVARALRDQRLIDRASDRRRWAARLRTAAPDDLQAALVGAFTRAFERWAAHAA
jgi:hypothetical protein